MTRLAGPVRQIGLVVPDIDGWDDSVGIHGEVMWMLRETNRPIFFYAEAEHG